MTETRRVVFAWLGLLALAALTLALSFLPLGPLATPTALLIALAKGALVVFVFMEILGTRVSSRLAFIIALLLLAILLLLAAADPLTRLNPARSPARSALPTRTDSPLARN